MSAEPKAMPSANVKQAVPFFMVRDMERSLAFYTAGLGFELKNKWTPRGKIEWCWLELGGASLMLQEFGEKDPRKSASDKLGFGVSVYFMCEDAIALYKEFRSRGFEAKRPFVGNGLWVTEVADPDGYALLFESPTDQPEESEYSE